jgi:predicted AlkP superfamily phosphohydrolase/phosphomutase
MAKTAIVGLDGCTFRLLDPLCEAGVMPAVKALREGAAERVLRSTTPAYTPPAWVSMLTGVNPGRHGVYGFLSSSPQDPVEIAHSGKIAATPIWRYVNDAGGSIGVFNVPMTYPPADVDGFLVSGGLAAGWTTPESEGFATDPDVVRLVSSQTDGTYPLDTVVSYENDWRSPAIIRSIADVHALRARVLRALLEARDVTMLFAVFEGPDRIQHLHYQYLVECSEWYARPEAAEFRDEAWAYFADLDRAIAAIARWVGSDGDILLVSDHGAGPWEKTLNVNLLLERWGLLRLPSLSRLTRLGVVAGPLQALARRVLPRRFLLSAKSGLGRRIDWSATTAFASQVAEQGIHVNARGSYPHGIVDPDGVPRARTELIERLTALIDPGDGRPVVDDIQIREEVFHGPFVARAPDLFPICRDQRYELSDTIAASGVFTDHRDRPWGYHHTNGVFIARGPSFRHGTGEPLDIVDVLPTALAAAGYPVPAGLDGRVALDALEHAEGARSPEMANAIENVQPAAGSHYPFSEKDEALIEESLRGLGYIE